MSNLKVSKHSVLRFLQRYHNLNIREVQNEMLSLAPLEAIETLGDGIYPDKTNTIRFLVIKNNIVTVLPMETIEHKERNKKQKKKRKYIKKSLKNDIGDEEENV